MNRDFRCWFGQNFFLTPVLCLLASLAPASAQGKAAPIVAVLELGGKNLAPDNLMLWTDLMRAALIERVGTAVRVMTPGNQNTLLGGADPEELEDCKKAGCDVLLLRQLGAAYGLVGNLTARKNGSISGTLTLYASATGKALGAAQILSPTEDGLPDILLEQTVRLADQIPEVRMAQAAPKPDGAIATDWQAVAGKPLQVLSQVVPASTLVEDKLAMMQAQLAMLHDEAISS